MEGGQRPPQPLPQREREGGGGEGVGGAAFSSHFGGRPSSLLPSTAAGDLQNEQEEEEERMEEEEHGERKEKGKTLFCAWCNSSFFSSSSLSLLAAPPSFSLSGKRRRQKPVGRRRSWRADGDEGRRDGPRRRLRSESAAASASIGKTDSLGRQMSTVNSGCFVRSGKKKGAWEEEEVDWALKASFLSPLRKRGKGEGALSTLTRWNCLPPPGKAMEGNEKRKPAEGLIQTEMGGRRPFPAWFLDARLEPSFSSFPPFSRCNFFPSLWVAPPLFPHP